jgi:hypothetical protein
VIRQKGAAAVNPERPKYEIAVVEAEDVHAIALRLNEMDAAGYDLVATHIVKRHRQHDSNPRRTTFDAFPLSPPVDFVLAIFRRRD